MKKHVFGIALCGIASLAACVTLIACGDGGAETEHIHTFETEWTRTEKEHYKKTTCGHSDVKIDEEIHNWGDGALKDVCTVCGYDKEGYASSIMYKVNGVDLDKYTIVYEKGNNANKQIAEKLAARLASYTGAELKCIADSKSDTGNEILVGSTNRKRAVADDRGSYTISKAVEDSVMLYSDSTSGIIAAGKKLAEDLYEGSVDYAADPVIAEYEDLSIKIMSYNIRYTDEDRWSRIKDVIMRNDPDVLGTQECSGNWQKKLKTDLSGYGVIGMGRDGEGTEACMILYKTAMFDLIDSGTRWFSSTPEAVGSKIPENLLPRIYNFAHLKRKSDGVEFLMVNTHMDLNQDGRLRSAEMLVESISAEFGNTTVFITGDFNTDCNWENMSGKELPLLEYDVDDLLKDEGFFDARLASPDTDGRATYPTSMYPSDASYPEHIIDYCFFKGKLLADRYYVDRAAPSVTATIPGLGIDASDHYPIIFESTLYKKL